MGVILLLVGAGIISLSVYAACVRRTAVLLPLLSPSWASSKLQQSERVTIFVDNGGFGFGSTGGPPANSRFLGQTVHRVTTSDGAALTTHVLSPPDITAARSWGVFLGARSFCWWFARSSSSVVLGSTKPIYIGALGIPFLLLGAWRLRKWARAARRSQRNLCPSCGYSRVGLTDDAPCPECGRQWVQAT